MKHVSTTPVSTELVQHMNTELITKIQELEEACNELEAAASQTGTVLHRQS